jgi:hypothetical protein
MTAARGAEMLSPCYLISGVFNPQLSPAVVGLYMQKSCSSPVTAKECVMYAGNSWFLSPWVLQSCRTKSHHRGLGARLPGVQWERKA